MSHKIDNFGVFYTGGHYASSHRSVSASKKPNAFTISSASALHSATAGAVGTSPTSTWTYTYNKRRLLTSESLSFDGAVKTLTYGYDANASASSLTYPSGLSLTYAPNALGQPTQAGSYATLATYHPNGSPHTWTFGNGVLRTRALNDRQLPESLRDTRNNVPLLDHTFTYDANGNLVDRIDGVPGELETTTLAYDGRDRLISAQVANKFGDELVVYDPLDNVRQAIIGPLDLRYHYTARNQLQRIADPNGTSLHDYVWNNRGALASRSRPGEPGLNDLFRDGFEDGGDVLPHTLTDFVHDPANRLRSIAGIATYTYDAHGHRLRTDRHDGTRRTALYTRSGQLLEETDTKTNQRIDLVSFNGSLIAKRLRPLNSNTATTVYLHSDARGTPSVESNTLGQTTFRARLTAFGSPYDGQWRDGPGFTGHVTDADSQLSYMQQRYFGALEFRFYAPDPVAAAILSDNRYWYANNNPYTFVDPDGREAVYSFSNGASFKDGAITLMYLMRSPTARGELRQLHDSGQTYRLNFDRGPDAIMNYDQDTSGLRVDTGIQSPALGAGYEISHAAERDRIGTDAFVNNLEAPVLETKLMPDGVLSVIYGTSPEEQRATKIESKIASELGEPTRSGYAQDRGEATTCGSTSQKEC